MVTHRHHFWKEAKLDQLSFGGFFFEGRRGSLLESAED